jgi:uncharacterized protein YegJ (DUF2314 family)
MTQVEYMWVLVTSFEDGEFRGTLDSTPRVLKSSMKAGQQVSVAKDDIYDWIYLDSGQQQGGFSIQFLEDKVKESNKDNQETP